MAASSTAYRCTKSIPKQISASSHLKSLLQIPKWDSFLPVSASVTTCPTGPDHKHVSERSADLGCNPLLEPELSFLTSTTYIHKMLWYRLSHRWESTWMRCFLLWFPQLKWESWESDWRLAGWGKLKSCAWSLFYCVHCLSWRAKPYLYCDTCSVNTGATLLDRRLDDPTEVRPVVWLAGLVLRDCAVPAENFFSPGNSVLFTCRHLKVRAVILSY